MSAAPVARRLLPLAVVALVLLTAAPAPAVIRPDTACRSGEVALTFDDGPSPRNTPRLLSLLRKHHAQATFFVQGQYTRRYPGILREAVRDGHAVEDHSWDHPQLTSRSNRSVKRQLKLTKDAIVDAVGVTPRYYRPPYGATDGRVRRLARHYGLHEVLWTVDTLDWTGRSPQQIRRAAVKGVRKHRPNVILMHDNVTNSPATLKAVPSVIKGLRAKGYCLVPLQLMMPLDVVSARPVSVVRPVDGSRLATVTFRLGGPAQRPGSFRVRSVDGTAVAGTDYRAVDRTVSFRRGARTATVHVRVYGAAASPGDTALTLRVDRAKALRVQSPTVQVTVTGSAGWDAPTTDLIMSTPGSPDTLAP